MMPETTIDQNETDLLTAEIITAKRLLDNWLGHRCVTRHVIEAFQEDKLFSYSIAIMATA